MDYRYGNNPNQYGYTSQYRGNQPQHTENLGGFGMNNMGSGYTRSQYQGLEATTQSGYTSGGGYQSLNPANQYGYTSQYRGNQPDHSENHGGFGMSNVGTGYTTGGYAGGGYTGGGSQYQGLNQANQYGYTSQYRGHQPEHSENHGGFGMSNVGTGYTTGGYAGGGSQYQGMNPANQYGYTSQYRGNQPEHSENHGGFGLSNVGGSYTSGGGYTSGTGYTGGGSPYQSLNPANQYGYTSQYRGNQPDHSENHGGFGLSNVGGNFTMGSGYTTGTGYTGTSSPYQGMNQANQYGYTNPSEGYGMTSAANQYGYTSQYRGYSTEHSEEPYGGSY